ncbi:ulp1 protease family, C-terminal catalytic domain-containing protein [Artemisia annua]|uniref:Ulp1 protease family, C-terminal catalytic domain-containing protein n=1 Tax=Artemisia annua TaxID=35608 RepID=A0A2U1N4Y0_ARTAN|nr:ulp1 protease family, C-terminal catalytic domain-containing protein [Artemisia annua]
MDRKWMYSMNINDPEFVNGVQSFLIAAESNRVAKGDIEIYCPCSQCKNFVPYNNIKAIEYHLLKFGFVCNYTCWSEHGESLVDNSTSIHVSNANEKNDSYINDKHENLNEMLHDLEANGDIDQEDLQQLRFLKCKNRNIPIVAPKEMYAKPWNEWIEYEAIVDLHVEGKVDISFIHWWAMHLHSVVNGLRENKFTFLNPHHISSGECLRNDKQVVNHILETRRLNLGKEIYVAPYLKGRHWLLFVVCPNLRAGYIVDSAIEDNERNYYFPEIVERAFEIKFDWTMAKCFQQKGHWECG